MQTTLRDAELGRLISLLTEQQARKVDLVAPAGSIRAEDSTVVVQPANGQMFTVADGQVTSTEPMRLEVGTVAAEGLAEKLSIPVAYMRRILADRPDLFDANVNGWLHGGFWNGENGAVGVEGDARSFLLRAFVDDNNSGLLRAVLSDRYAFMDNLDVLTAALDGIRASGVEVVVDGCDLTERRMSVRIAAPGIAALAPLLLDGYRRPWAPGHAPWETQAGRDHGWLQPDDRPIVFAGFVLSNSETGGGAFTLTPRIIVQICRNGLTITKDALRSVHLGGRMDHGVIRWTHETERRNLALVTAQARDAVSTFLDADYVQAKVDELEGTATTRITQPQRVIEVVTQRLGIPTEYREAVFDHFLTGGQATAGGVMQAITALAQEVADPDVARDMEERAVQALDLAASLA